MSEILFEGFLYKFMETYACPILDVIIILCIIGVGIVLYLLTKVLRRILKQLEKNNG